MRQCGAGRRRTSCGDNTTGRSYRYCVTWRSATWILKGFSSYTTSNMKIFHCDHCGHLLFFENTACVGCRPPRRLPARSAAGRLARSRWRRTSGALPSRRRSTGYRLCQNDKIEGICNWAVPADDDNPLCVSCRITRVIPNLAEPANRAAWYRLEAAKRRLLFTLIELGLPMANRIDDPERRADVRVSRGCRPERRAGADRPRRRRHHRQHRRGRRCRA